MLDMAEDTRKAIELCRGRRFEQNALKRAKGAQNIGVPELVVLFCLQNIIINRIKSRDRLEHPRFHCFSSFIFRINN